MVHVGNELTESDITKPEKFYLKRKSLLDGEMKTFSKHDIVNADTQMQSIIKAGIDVEYGHFSNRKSIKNMLKAGKRIRKLSKQPDIDMVHVFWGSTTGLITCLFSAKPVIVSFCGSDLLGNKNINGGLTKGGKINRHISRLVSRLSKHNITKSASMKSFLPASAQRKTTVVPNGVDLSGFYPINRDEARKKLELNLEKKYILYFYTEGQVVKNPNFAFKAIEEVKKRVQDVEVLVATKISHEELISYYNACDVMILTSFHEGSNNSIKEANACNLPIVSVNVGDAKERLQGVTNSFVVELGDLEGMVSRVVEVLKKGNRSNGVSKSHEVSVPNIANQVIQVYKGIR